MNQNEYDHSRFDDIFGGQNDYEDVGLESALAASKMQPTAKPAEIEGDDHTSGYIIPVIKDDASPIVKYLRSVKWSR